MPNTLRRPHLAVLAATALLAAACDSTPVPPSGTGTEGGEHTPKPYALKWSDEFDGAAGAAVDGTKWAYDIGGDGWGNQEREYYTPGTENAALDGAGNLVITAREEPASTTRHCWYGACRYTSARLLTKGRMTWSYGRFEARMKLPRGQGIWPAFWMLGADIDQVGWPKSGEIDVMESIGREPKLVYGTVHGPGFSGGNGIGSSYSLAPEEVSDNFHVYAVEWEPGQIRWLVDDKEFRRVVMTDIPAGGTWVFDKPFFMILNVAVGGTWPGDPDGTGTFPQRMLVDYVRVYQRG